MVLIALSAAFVGFVHSLAPGHWLPVVITAKGQRWPLSRALAGAVTLASGHVVVSAAIGLVSIIIGHHLLSGNEEQLERYAALMLFVFGLVYAGSAYFRHSTCHGHEHHTPVPEELAGGPSAAVPTSAPGRRRAPFLFLFTVGLFPCVAVLPVFLAAAAMGTFAVVLTMVAFAVGVTLSLCGSTAVAVLGLLKLDHPIFEHHGDVITGLAVAAMGGVLYIIPV